MTKKFAIYSNSDIILENLCIQKLQIILETNLNDYIDIQHLSVDQMLDKPFRIKHKGQVVEKLYTNKNSKFYVYVKRTL